MFPWRDLERHSSLCLNLLAETKMYLGPNERKCHKLLGLLTLTHAVSWAAPQCTFPGPVLCTQRYAQSWEFHGEQKQTGTFPSSVTVLCWSQKLN